MSAFAQAKVNVKEYVFIAYLVDMLEERYAIGDEKAGEFLPLVISGDYDHVLIQGFRERDEESDDSVVGRYEIITTSPKSREVAVKQVQRLIKQVLGATGGVPSASELGCDFQYLSDKLGYSDHDLESVEFTLLKEGESEGAVLKGHRNPEEGQ